MDRPNSSLIQFDSVLLDVNENPSNAEYNVINDVAEQPESASTNGSFRDDINLSNSSNFLQPSSPKLPESVESDKHNVFGQKSNSVYSDRNSGSGKAAISDIHRLENGTISGSHYLENSADSEHIVVETGKLLDITGNLNLSNGYGGFVSDLNSEENEVSVSNNEVFHDAVQFFKDPTSLTFLENAGGNNDTDSFSNRSSLYVNFDPLHAKFSSQTVKKSSELEEISEDDPPQELQEESVSKDATPTVNKRLAIIEASPRQSIGNIMSFDSPVINKDIDNTPPECLIPSDSEPPTLFTEDDLQQALKKQELTMQEAFIKQQQDIEKERGHKLEEMEEKIKKQNILYSSLNDVCRELVEIACTFSDEKKQLQTSLENAEKEIDKLKEEVKTSNEDLQSVENTFADFHKRYEQSKSMLKVYLQNEGNLKQQIENMNIKLQEKEEMYNALQSRTQEMVDKANTELANAKRAGDSQAAVLNAQLKKAELKISSLESDVKHVKIENGKLSSICDELMAKVSEA